MIAFLMGALTWFNGYGVPLPLRVLHVHPMEEEVLLVRDDALLWGTVGPDSFHVRREKSLPFRVFQALSIGDTLVLRTTRGVMFWPLPDGLGGRVFRIPVDTVFLALGSVWARTPDGLRDLQKGRRLRLPASPRRLWGRPCGLAWQIGDVLFWTLDGREIHRVPIPGSGSAWDCSGDTLLWAWGDDRETRVRVVARGDTLFREVLEGRLVWARFTGEVPVVFRKVRVLWELWIAGRRVPWPARLLWFRPYAPGVWWGLELYPLQITLFRPDAPPEIQAEGIHLHPPFSNLYAPREVVVRDEEGDGDPDFWVFLATTTRLPDSLRARGLLVLRNMSRELVAWKDSVAKKDLPYWPPSRVRARLREVEVALYFGQLLWPGEWGRWWRERKRLLSVLRIHKRLEDFRDRAFGWLLAFMAGLALMFFFAWEERQKPSPPAEAIRKLLAVKFFHDIKYLLPDYTLDGGTLAYLEGVAREMTETLHQVGGAFRQASWSWRWWQRTTLMRVYAFRLWLREPLFRRWISPARMYRFLLGARKTWGELLSQPGVVEDLPGVLQEVASRLRHLFPGVDLVLQIRDAFEVSCMFYTSDIRMLQRLLFGLLENAAEAGARTIRVEAVQTEEGLELTLTDDGIGLAPELRALSSRERVRRIFSTGFTARKGEGHHQGRGLSEELLMWMEERGEIWIEPREGTTGTQVVLLFRYCRSGTENQGGV